MTTKQFTLAAAMLAAMVSQAPAAGVNDLFNFEFYASPNIHIGTDTYRHHTDFVHYNDYYRFGRLPSASEHTTCRESWARSDEGGVVKRITCRSR